MKKFLFISLFVSILGVSCKKNDPTPTPTPEPDKYMSLTPGSSWNYQKVDSSNNISTYTLSSSDHDTTITIGSNNIKYHIFNSTDTSGPTESYYNITGNDYSQFASLGARLPGFDLVYLKEKAPKDSTWTTHFMTTQTFTILNQNIPAVIDADIVNTIDSTDLKMTVNNIAYSNVVKVKTELQNVTITLNTFLGPQIIPTAITQDNYNYYAPKYGKIKGRDLLNITAQYFGTTYNLINNNSTTNLLSAVIK